MTDTPRPLLPWPEEPPIGDSPGWESIDLPDKEAWSEAYIDLFGPYGQTSHPERASRLVAYGWTPEALRTVCAAPHNITTMHPPESATEFQTVALAALAEEARAFFLLGVAASADRLQSYAAHVSETHRWGPEEALALLGVNDSAGEPFEALAKQMWVDHPSRVMGPGPVADALRTSLDDRHGSDWLTPEAPTKGPFA